MSFFNDMRTAIVTKLGTLSNLQEVHFAQRSEYEGSPVAVVGVQQNEGLWNSNTTDKMTFVFQILIYIPLRSDSDAATVETNMGDAYSEVLVAFMDRQALGSAADFVEPIPSSWGFEERDSGIYRYAEINLRCVKYMPN